MAERRFFNRGRRVAISGWALNLSVVFISSGLVSEVFTQLSRVLKIAVISWGLVLMLVGVMVAPEKEGDA